MVYVCLYVEYYDWHRFCNSLFWFIFCMKCKTETLFGFCGLAMSLSDRIPGIRPVDDVLLNYVFRERNTVHQLAIDVLFEDQVVVLHFSQNSAQPDTSEQCESMGLVISSSKEVYGYIRDNTRRWSQILSVREPCIAVTEQHFLHIAKEVLERQSLEVLCFQL